MSESAQQNRQNPKEDGREALFRLITEEIKDLNEADAPLMIEELSSVPLPV